MANANKPSQGSSTQQGMNVSSGDVDSQQNQKGGQKSPQDANRQANQTGKQGSGKNK